MDDIITNNKAAEYSPLMPLVNEKIENIYGGKYYGAGASMMNFTYSLGSIIGPIALRFNSGALGY